MDYWKKIRVETFRGEKKLLIDFTQEELIFEKVKCSIDSVHVIETYFYIFDQTKNNGDGEIIPFILFPFQRDLIDSYEKNRFNITNKYRQAGVSTVTCAWLATYISCNENRSVAIVANKLETARDELMKDVTNFIDMLPPFLHPGIFDKDAANHKTYKNGSQVKAFATNSLRGYTPTFLFWDETAWCENGESFWTGTLPSLSTGGNAALVSCVTKDTMVWTDAGLIDIAEIIESKLSGSYMVKEYEVLGRDIKRKGNILKNTKYNTTKKIKTEHVSIESTKLHKFWAYNNKTGRINYCPAGQLKEEDYIALQYGTNKFGDLKEIKYILNRFESFSYYNYQITENFSDLLALFYKKGNLNVKSINKKLITELNIDNLNKMDRDIIDRFLAEFRNEYPSNYYQGDIKYDKTSFYCKLQPLTTIFYHLDLNFDKKFDTFLNRTLTKHVRRLDGKFLKRFVKTYIKLSADKELGDNWFKIKINSPYMGRQLQQILLNEGVISTYEADIDIKRIGEIRDRYLMININYDYYLNTDQYNPKINDQKLPLGISHNVNRILKLYGVKLPFGFYTRFQLLDIIEQLDDVISDEDKIKLNGYVSKDIYWSRVIKTDKNKNYTYDFSLPNNPDDIWAHSVIYNGLLGHQTPNGLDPVFYRTYDNAKNGVSEFIANELHWYNDPRYTKDIIWKKKNMNGDEIQIKETNIDNFKNLIMDGWKPWSPWYESMASKFDYDKKKIAQEIECSFLGSGNNFIDEENIKRIEDMQLMGPLKMEYDDLFWIWEEPIPDERYVMTVDVSTGAGDDFSTIIILKQHESHLEEVAEFKGKVSPDTLGIICRDYGIRYNEAYAIVDITGGIGSMTVKTMLDLGYKNMHYTVSRHEPTKEKLNDYVKTDDNNKVLVPGFVISTGNRGMVLSEMKRAIESNEVIIRSHRLTSEFKTFITTTNTRVADHRRSFNDDLIIALAMGVYVFSYDIMAVGMSVEKTKKMLDAITSNVTDHSSNTTNTNNNIPINTNNPYYTNNWLFKGLKR